jgi:hypothetical protein
MAILSKGNTYSSGDAVTAANLNSLVDSATFVSGSNQTTDDSTLEVHSSGYLKIKDGGVDETQLANGAVTSAKLDASFEITAGEIADNAVTLAKMEHGTAGDLLSYNTSAEPVRVSLGAASSYLRVNAAANAVEWSSSAPVSKYSTGWFNNSSGLANGGTYTITHNLGTADFVATIWVADDSSGTNNQVIFSDSGSSGAGSKVDGAVVADASTTTLKVQLGANGGFYVSSTGTWSSFNWSAKYFKIVVIG